MTGSQSVLDDSARFEVNIINMTQHCTEIKQSKALGAVYWISTGPLALLLRALTIPRMRLWVCCFWCCRSTHCVAHTLPTTLSSQRLWPTRTCSTVSLFNTVFGRCTEKKKMQRKVILCMVCCSVMCGAQSHQWDGVNLLGRERKHQPAQMFHIPNVPIWRLPERDIPSYVCPKCWNISCNWDGRGNQK